MHQPGGQYAGADAQAGDAQGQRRAAVASTQLQPLHPVLHSLTPPLSTLLQRMPPAAAVGMLAMAASLWAVVLPLAMLVLAVVLPLLMVVPVSMQLLSAVVVVAAVVPATVLVGVGAEWLTPTARLHASWARAARVGNLQQTARASLVHVYILLFGVEREGQSQQHQTGRSTFLQRKRPGASGQPGLREAAPAPVQVPGTRPHPIVRCNHRVLKLMLVVCQGAGGQQESRQGQAKPHAQPRHSGSLSTGLL